MEVKLSATNVRPAMAVIGCGMATFGVPAASASASAATSTFTATIDPISAELADEMHGVSWHPGCPVEIAELRLISMNHWGFDGQLHDGELVVHADVATDVVGVFATLFGARFPIMRMERIEHYGGVDDESMAADNTSAFNCRQITGGGSFSVHSWGKAIDINTVENPYVRGSVVLPPDGAAYLDRGDVRPGMIVAGDVVVEAFAAIGWEWGGDWSRLQDYQHFETDGGGTRPDVWDGRVDDLIGENGVIDVAAFNAFLDTAPMVNRSPYDAARALLHVGRTGDEGDAVTIEVARSAGAGATVTVTVDNLADDSTRAVRFVLRFEDHGDGTARLAEGTWSQRCQPGRGHEDFSPELCV